MGVFRGLWGGFRGAVGTPSREVSEADLRGGHREGPPARPLAVPRV